MSSQDSIQSLPYVQIEPDPYHAALVVCHSSNSGNKQFEDESRLYVTTNGAFVLHTGQGAYPVRGVVLVGNGLVRLHSEDWRIVEIDGGERFSTEWYETTLYIADVAWKAAMDFALTLPRPAENGTNELSVWMLPVSTAAYALIEKGVAQ